MIMIAAFLLSMSQPVLDDCIYYPLPESAGAEESSKAAQALAARCRGYGYKGIQTTVIECDGRKSVQVLCDMGLTPEMKTTLTQFSRLSGTSVELRFPLLLSDVDREQYQPGARPSEDKAPPGARWFRYRNPELPPVLLRETPVVTKGEMQMKTKKERSGSTRTFWEISSLQSREIREAEKKSKLGIPVLVMDGWAIEPVPLNTLEKNEEGRIVSAPRLYFMPTSSIVQEALAHPMPFVLDGEEPPQEPR